MDVETEMVLLVVQVVAVMFVTSLYITM